MQDPFYRQDVFFFITTVAVIILTIILTVIGVYMVKIFRDIKYITRKARTEADLISEDIHELRDNVRTEGVKVASLIKFFSKIYSKKK